MMTTSDTTNGLEAGPAVFSDDRRYRYLLTRTWDETRDSVLYIGLNPSTADEVALDPTLRRCVSFARGWGYGSFQMANLFGYRAKEPQDMKDALEAGIDPVGPANDEWILRAAIRASLIVAAWGVHGCYRDRDREVFCMLRKRGFSMGCLGLTKEGHPKHPLYLRSTTQLERFRGLRF